MNERSFSRGEKSSFEDVARDTEPFLALLRDNGIELAGGGQLERACAVLLDLDHRRQNFGKDLPWLALREDLQLAVGLHVLIRNLLAVRGHANFGTLFPHLRLLARTTGENPGPGAFASARDDAANKIFELLAGIAALRCGTDVEMDDPDRSSGGTNPDVLFRAPDGVRWGLACKAVHGQNPRSYFDLFVDGVDQIERAACDTGIVVTTIKNRIRHDATMPRMGEDPDGFPLIGAHRDINELRGVLQRLAHERVGAMVHDVTKDDVWAQLRGKKALPGLICLASTTVIAKMPFGPMPSLVTEAAVEMMEFSPAALPTRFTLPTNAFVLRLIAGLS